MQLLQGSWSAGRKKTLPEFCGAPSPGRRGNSAGVRTRHAGFCTGVNPSAPVPPGMTTVACLTLLKHALNPCSIR